MTDRTELRLTLRWQLARLLDRWAWALLRDCVGCEAFDEYAVAWPCPTIRAIGAES